MGVDGVNSPEFGEIKIYATMYPLREDIENLDVTRKIKIKGGHTKLCQIKLKSSSSATATSVPYILFC